MQQLVDELMLSCPYAYNSKEYWIYNAGLLRTMVARYSETDWIIRNEITARTRSNLNGKPK